MQKQDLILDETFFQQLSRRDGAVEILGFSGSEKAYVIAKVFLQQRVSCLVIVSTPRQGEQLIEDLRFFIGNPDTPILFFPSYNTLPFKFLSYHNEIAGNRIRVLYQLLEETTPVIVVATVESLLKKIIH